MSTDKNDPSQHDLFAEARGNGQLMFATDAFHSYVHEWGCQLRYNPRLNRGWGMSDGGGNERTWSALSPLVAPLRHSTKQHRVDLLDFKCDFLNRTARKDAGRLDVYSTYLRNKKPEIATVYSQSNGTSSETNRHSFG